MLESRPTASAWTPKCASSGPKAVKGCSARWRAEPRPTAGCSIVRSTRDLLDTLAAVTDRKAGFRSFGDTRADSTTPHGRLMLAVFGGLAEFERELIRARTSEGQARAKANGVRLDRKPKLTAPEA